MKRENESGVALLITLLVVALLTASVLEFFYSASVSLTLSDNFSNKTKAAYIARGGVLAAQEILADDGKNQPTYDALTEDWAMNYAYPLSENNGSLSFVITDENSKMNLNSFAPAQQVPPNQGNPVVSPQKVAAERLFSTLELDSTLLANIQDWIDPDNIVTNGGNEGGYYSALSPSYRIKNGHMSTLQELFLVAKVDNEAYKTLSPHVTVHSNMLVNINTASKTVLTALSPLLGEEVVDEIMRWRENTPFATTGDLWQVSGFTQELLQKITPLITVKSDYYSVESTGIVEDAVERYKVFFLRNGADVKMLSFQSL